MVCPSFFPSSPQHTDTHTYTRGRYVPRYLLESGAAMWLAWTLAVGRNDSVISEQRPNHQLWFPSSPSSLCEDTAWVLEWGQQWEEAQQTCDGSKMEVWGLSLYQPTDRTSQALTSWSSVFTVQSSFCSRIYHRAEVSGWTSGEKNCLTYSWSWSAWSSQSWRSRGLCPWPFCQEHARVCSDQLCPSCSVFPFLK